MAGLGLCFIYLVNQKCYVVYIGEILKIDVDKLFIFMKSHRYIKIANVFSMTRIFFLFSSVTLGVFDIYTCAVGKYNEKPHVNYIYAVEPIDLPP